MGWRKGKKRSLKTRNKMRIAAEKRWKKKKIGILEIAKQIKDEDRKTWKEHEEEEQKINCPFCNNQIKIITPMTEKYYYCKNCNMIINPALRWKVKLPQKKKESKDNIQS